ncbi:MAG: TolB family protein, partial [Blastocatellia bacterium]
MLFKIPHSGNRILAAIATFTVALIPRAGFGRLSTTAAALSKPSVTELSLGTIDQGWIDYSLAISPDGKHLAYVAKRENGRCVVLDGHAGRTYPDIPEQHLTERGRDPQIRFSPQGGHIAYVARRADGYVVVTDHREGKPYEYIEVGAPVFSSDGNRLAYVAKRDGKELIVADEVEGKPFDYLG